MKKHYLVYQITNLINYKIYIGVHQTYDINDCYMGSGKLIKTEQKDKERRITRMDRGRLD